MINNNITTNFQNDLADFIIFYILVGDENAS